ncbi:MAG: hypothetical protein JSW00_08935 [Thermoplasmata archaeon]|nr:MAG: hypothetical protein JSW00_08935 [Thermoplasmata archaeon]
MAVTQSDDRVVKVSLTNAELATVVGTKARELGFIDFTPDSVDLVNDGLGNWEATFQVATVPAGG